MPRFGAPCVWNGNEQVLAGCRIVNVEVVTFSFDEKTPVWNVEK